jgi:hypothetical protein
MAVPAYERSDDPALSAGTAAAGSSERSWRSILREIAELLVEDVPHSDLVVAARTVRLEQRSWSALQSSTVSMQGARHPRLLSLCTTGRSEGQAPPSPHERFAELAQQHGYTSAELRDSFPRGRKTEEQRRHSDR